MRWLYALEIFMMVLLLSGQLFGQPPSSTHKAMTTQLVFHYDFARDVVIASSVPLAGITSVTPQSYADKLADVPQMSYVVSPDLQLASPRPAVTNDVVIANYRKSAGLLKLSTAQLTAVMATLEGWWWIPTVNKVVVQVRGVPLTYLGSVPLTQPVTHTYHTYLVQPQTGEVAYLGNAFTPITLADAVDMMQKRQITEAPAIQGFQPLLPPDTSIMVSLDKITTGVLPVELSANFPREQTARLAGIILMLSQFPEVNAISLTFGGKSVDAPFMLGNLNVPISPHALLLPVNVARLPTSDELKLLQDAVQAKLGHQPASVGTGLIWRDWAMLTAVPADGAVPQTYLLQKGNQGYSVRVSGANVVAGQLLKQQVPRDMIIAFRISGWESLIQV